MTLRTEKAAARIVTEVDILNVNARYVTKQTVMDTWKAELEAWWFESGKVYPGYLFSNLNVGVYQKVKS